MTQNFIKLANRTLTACFIMFCTAFQTFASSELNDPRLCHSNIEQKICYVEDQTHRKCLDKPKELKYINVAETIDKILNKAPNLIKRAVCRLDQIKIARKTYEEGAVAFVNPNEKHRIVNFSLNSFINEHDSFWGNDRALFQYQFESHGAKQNRVISDLAYVSHRVYFEPNRISDINYGIAETLFHELAHIIEYDPTLNPLAPLNIFRCFKMADIQRKKLAQDQDKIIKGYDNIFIDQLDQPYDSKIINELSESAFISFYAVTNVDEDFAETLASYIMLKYLGVNEKMVGKSGLIYERKARFKHKNMQAKLNIIKKYVHFDRLSDQEKEKLKQDQLHCRGDFAQAGLMRK